ncbi:MAG TPA: SH3 domain-containing protein, partial [Candidatus Ozemobacteraceae bacterium]|nr:SH3 domain-containing protein [Candidatus Ozemobacteraceae bacterium]
MKRFFIISGLILSLLPAGSTCSAAGGSKLTPFAYTVPTGGMSRTVRIMHIASGTPRLAHMGLHKGGEVIKLELSGWPGDHVQVMINGILKEDLPLQTTQPVQATQSVQATATQIFAKPPDAASAASPADAAASVAPAIASEAVIASPATATASPPAQPIIPGKPQRIVTAAAVRLRASPSTTAAELAKLSLGTLVTELAAGTTEEKIGSRSAKWYRVSLPDGREGWLFGAFTVPLPADDRDKAFVKLAQERLALEKQSANDLLELYQFLQNSIPTGMTDASKAELEFHALLALNRYLSMPGTGGTPGKLPSGIASHAAELVYSEPAGMYMCQYNRFWELHGRLKGRPGAEELAWKASRQPIPGETEGFYDLMLAQLNETVGRYLRAYPDGSHAGEALKSIDRYLFTS